MSEYSIDANQYAIKLFESIIDWKDSRTKIDECKQRIEEIRIAEERAEEERKRKAEEAHRTAEKRKAKIKKITKITAVAASSVAALIICIIVLTTVISKAKNKAAFEQQKENLKNISVGSTVRFGLYEQDNDTSNGKEEVEWQVLAVEGKKALLISKYAMDCQPYNTELMSVTWEACTLRKWLNGDFYNTAFGSEHQKLIVQTTVINKDNARYDTDGGSDTEDKVFLLSIDEANEYFSSDAARQCAPTDYAIAQNAWTSDTNTIGGRATCWWWLRSPGGISDHAAFVSSGGSVSSSGLSVYDDDGAVRPALWINL